MTESKALVTQKTDEEITSEIVLRGNLADLNNKQRAIYVKKFCDELGISWLTQPFDWLELNGRTVLYAKKACSEQLRKKYGITLTVLEAGILKVGDIATDVYYVKAQATMPDGRSDVDVGTVSVKGQSGEALANSIMRCHTKAKRRVTLSICGLGMPDESEIDTIPRAKVERTGPKVLMPKQEAQVQEAQAEPTQPEPLTVSQAVEIVTGTEQLTNLPTTVSTVSTPPAKRFPPVTPPIVVKVRKRD